LSGSSAHDDGVTYRLLAALAFGGLLLGAAAGSQMVLSPPSIQQLVQEPMGSALVVLLAGVTVASLLAWGRESGHPDRRAGVAAITFGMIAVTIVNVIAPAAGLWGGPVFDGPLVPLALLTGLKSALYIGLALALFRWLARRSAVLAGAVCALILAALIPVTVLADEAVLRSGVLTFGAGYTVWHDVLLGEAFFALPILAFLVLRRPTTAT
jgi:hypothetical protein